MNSTSIDNIAARPNGVIKAKLSRDDIIMRGGMAVIALYLVISLVFPLYAMFSKSFSTFQYDLSKFEVQVSDDAGQFSPAKANLQSLNDGLQALSNAELSTGSGGRLGVTVFFPDFSFRSPVMYRIRNVDQQGRFLVGSTLVTGTDWQELDSNNFRRVQLRPLRSTGLSNFINYFNIS